MEPPILNLPDEVTFTMQVGLARDSITVDVGDLNLKSLKDLACNFVDKKVHILFLSLNFFFYVSYNWLSFWFNLIFGLHASKSFKT